MKAETIIIPYEEKMQGIVSDKLRRMSAEEFRQKYGHIFEDVFTGKQIVLTKEEAKIFDQGLLQGLSDIRAGRVRRVL